MPTVLYDEQMEVFTKIIDYFSDLNRGADVMVFNAPGGTGKTTIIREVVKNLSLLGVKGLVCAFTGRAAAQLRKGGLAASTFHSVMYAPILDKDGVVTGWHLRSIQEMKDAVGSYIICDEASMVNFETVQGMLALEIPILFVGHEAQLPPVEQNEEYKDFNPMNSFDCETLSLTKNRRVTEGLEGLLKINAHFRESNGVPRFLRGGGIEFIRKCQVDIDYLKENEFDIILCGKNATRRKMNEIVRRAKGYTTDVPQEGEQVVCLRNGVIEERKISNGDIFKVMGTIGGEKESTLMLQNTDTGERITAKVWNETWATEKYPDGKYPRHGQPQTHQIMAYGYSISVHKAQRSTFSSVLFYDEDVSFFLDQQRFRYTAVSRAADKLTYAM